MTVNSTQPRAPVEVRDVETFIEAQIRGPLLESIAKTDLPPEGFIKDAIDSRDAILAEVAPLRNAVEDLRRRFFRQRKNRNLQIGATAMSLVGIAGVILAAVFSASASLFWTLNAAIGIVIFGLLLATRFPLRSPGGSSSSPSSKSPLSLREQLAIAEVDYREALERAIQRWVTDRANKALGSIYAALLPDLKPEGLGEIDDAENEIPTESRGKLESLIEHMPGGSIGLSGPRGVGKTTLLKRVTSRAREENPDQVRAAIVVDAPVEFDARDFVLHLFARLCESALRPDDIEALRSGEPGFRALRHGHPRSDFLKSWPVYIGPLLFVAGGVAYLALLDAQGRLDPSDWELGAVTAMLIGVVLTGVTVLNRLPNGLPAFVRLRRVRGQSSDVNFLAERYLRQIWFQRTLSSGRSAGLKVPFGLEMGGERSTQLAENQLTYPDVVDQYKRFARELAREGEVRIGIDEIDKMDEVQARRFLNEIKVIFRVSNCFYLISVSEDAMAYFERRGLPIRDVFDSSFDDIMRAGYFHYVDSKRLLLRRVVGLPAQFIALAHILGGGLARDVIRAARDISELPSGTTLAEVTERLCAEQLGSKSTAARIAIRKLEDPVQVMLLSQWLAAVEATFARPEPLIGLCCSFEGDIVVPLGPAPLGDDRALIQHREALSIALEVISFGYFIATLQELMDALETPEAARGAIHSGVIDHLAEARQEFAVNPAEAWAAVSTVREDRFTGDAVNFPALQKEALSP